MCSSSARSTLPSAIATDDLLSDSVRSTTMGRVQSRVVFGRMEFYRLIEVFTLVDLISENYHSMHCSLYVNLGCTRDSTLSLSSSLSSQYSSFVVGQLFCGVFTPRLRRTRFITCSVGFCFGCCCCSRWEHILIANAN